MTKDVQRTDPRIDRTRTAVLDATEALFEEGGWDVINHSSVSARSRVGRTTLYRHWPDKASLVRDAIVRKIGREQASVTGDLREDLRACLEILRGRLVDGPACQGMITVLQQAEHDPAFAETKAAISEAATSTLASTLRSGQRRGELPASMDVSAAIDALCGPLFFRGLFSRRALSHSFVDEIVDQFLAAQRATTS